MSDLARQSIEEEQQRLAQMPQPVDTFAQRFAPALPGLPETYASAGMPYQDRLQFNEDPNATFRAYDKAAAKANEPPFIPPIAFGEGQPPQSREQIENYAIPARMAVPSSLPDLALYGISGPIGRTIGKLGQIVLGAGGIYGTLTDEAQAGKLNTLGRLVRGAAAEEPALARGAAKVGGGAAEDAARGVENWRLGGTVDPATYAPPAMGHNLPPTGSLNPLDNQLVTFRGKEPKDFTPEDWQAFGQYYNTDKPLGPLSPLQTFKDVNGNEFQLPGGIKGEWTYYDLLHMKANPINPANVDRGLHAEMQGKLGRTMTPTSPSDEQTWNGLIFGMTSPNNPLFPNQLSASRLRLRTPEMLDDLANMIPWKPGEEVSPEARKAVSDAIAAKYQLNKASEGGLGSRGTADYSRVGEMAQLFRENPQFFRKQDNESWGQAVERISSQLPGLSMKTGSFGTVWQNPAEAGISAIDRHMAKKLEQTGQLFADPAERIAWENRGVGRWNQREVKRVANEEKANAQLVADGQSPKKIAPADIANNFDDLLAKRGSDGFIGEMLLDHVGDAKTPVFRKASGQINPDIPQHLAQANWVREPDTVYKMGAAYKRALDLNQQIAKENGLDLFMSQWMEWDRIRNRFEPHENMFPGLSQTPAMSVEQLRGVDLAHKETGHKTYGKDPEGSLLPTRPLSGLPSRMGYLGLGGAVAGAAAMSPDQAEAGKLVLPPGIGSAVRGAAEEIPQQLVKIRQPSGAVNWAPQWMKNPERWWGGIPKDVVIDPSMPMDVESRMARRANSPFTQDVYHASGAGRGDSTPLPVERTFSPNQFSQFKLDQPGTSDFGIHVGSAGQAENRSYGLEQARFGNPLNEAEGPLRGGGHTYPLAADFGPKGMIGGEDVGTWGPVVTEGILRRSGEFTPEEIAKAKAQLTPTEQLQAYRDLIRSKGFGGIQYTNRFEVGEGTTELEREKDRLMMLRDTNPRLPRYELQDKIDNIAERIARIKDETTAKSYAIADPSQLRSRFMAIYDPRNIGKSFLAGSVAGTAAMPLLGDLVRQDRYQGAY